jgi:hypothetical protein
MPIENDQIKAKGGVLVGAVEAPVAECEPSGAEAGKLKASQVPASVVSRSTEAPEPQEFEHSIAADLMGRVTWGGQKYVIPAGITDTAAAIQAIVTATGGDAAITLAGGDHHWLSTVEVPSSIARGLDIEAGGANVVMGGSCSVMFKPKRTADYQTFQRVLLKRFKVDASAVSTAHGNNVFFGAWVNDSHLQRVNWDRIYFYECEVTGIPTGTLATGKLIGAIWLDSFEPGPPWPGATECRCTNVEVTKCRFEGGDFGANITSTPAGSSQPTGTNVFYDNILFQDSFANLAGSPTVFASMGGFQVGGSGYGRKVRFYNCHVSNSSDVGYEIDSMQDVLMVGCTATDCTNPFYFQTFNASMDSSKQSVVLYKCRAKYEKYKPGTVKWTASETKEITTVATTLKISTVAAFAHSTGAGSALHIASGNIISWTGVNIAESLLEGVTVSSTLAKLTITSADELSLRRNPQGFHNGAINSFGSFLFDQCEYDWENMKASEVSLEGHVLSFSGEVRKVLWRGGRVKVACTYDVANGAAFIQHSLFGLQSSTQKAKLGVEGVDFNFGGTRSSTPNVTFRFIRYGGTDVITRTHRNDFTFSVTTPGNGNLSHITWGEISSATVTVSADGNIFTESTDVTPKPFRIYNSGGGLSGKIREGTLATFTNNDVSRLNALAVQQVYCDTTTEYARVLVTPNAQRRVTVTEAHTTKPWEKLVTVTSTGTTLTVKAPQANEMVPGEMYVLKDEGGAASSHPITLEAQGSDTIEGEAKVTISGDYGFLRYYSTGTKLVIA